MPPVPGLPVGMLDRLGPRWPALGPLVPPRGPDVGAGAAEGARPSPKMTLRTVAQARPTPVFAQSPIPSYFQAGERHGGIGNYEQGRASPSSTGSVACRQARTQAIQPHKKGSGQHPEKWCGRIKRASAIISGEGETPFPVRDEGKRPYRPGIRESGSGRPDPGIRIRESGSGGHAPRGISQAGSTD